MVYTVVLCIIIKGFNINSFDRLLCAFLLSLSNLSLIRRDGNALLNTLYEGRRRKEEGGKKKEEGRSVMSDARGGRGVCIFERKVRARTKHVCMDGVCRGTCVLFTMEVFTVYGWHV